MVNTIKLKTVGKVPDTYEFVVYEFYPKQLEIRIVDYFDTSEEARNFLKEKFAFSYFGPDFTYGYCEVDNFLKG